MAYNPQIASDPKVTSWSKDTIAILKGILMPWSRGNWRSDFAISRYQESLTLLQVNKIQSLGYLTCIFRNGVRS